MERCPRQCWNVPKRSPEEVGSRGLSVRDGDVRSTVPGMIRFDMVQEVGGVARGPRLRSVPLKRWLTCMCLSGKEAGSFVQYHHDVSPWVQPKRGGADHCSFVRGGDVVRLVGVWRDVRCGMFRGVVVKRWSRAR